MLAMVRGWRQARVENGPKEADANQMLAKVLGADVEGSVGGSSLWLHAGGAAATERDPRDANTPDAWVPRSNKLIRHPRTAPGARGGGCAGEPTPELLASGGFLTPPALQFFDNPASVPMIDHDKFQLNVEVYSTATRKKRSQAFRPFKLRQMQKKNVTVTIASAGLRGAELKAMKVAPEGSNFGAGAIATGVWTGVPLVELLRQMGVYPAHAAMQPDTLVVFQGPDRQVGIDGGSPYESCMLLSEAVDPARSIIVAYQVNGKPLTPDCGAPLRLVVPGSVDARCVKWLTTIKVGPLNEPTTFHFRERTRLFPPSARSVNEGTGRRLDAMPVTSAILVPGHKEVVTVDPYKPRKVTLRGWAYAGRGKAINAVEVSLDRGVIWHPATIEGDRSNFNGKRPEHSWCWTLWMLSMESPLFARNMLNDSQIWVRATDACGNTQPEEAAYNFLGLANNGFYKIKAKCETTPDNNLAISFLHPCMRELDGTLSGWMETEEHVATAAPAPAPATELVEMMLPPSSTVEKVAPPAPAAIAAPALAAVAPAVQRKADEPEYTWEEINKHDKDDDVWIVINDVVYDCTKYLEKHPGGAASITMNAGEDTTEDFTAVHSSKAWNDLQQWRIGTVAGTAASASAAEPPTTPVAETQQVWTSKEDVKVVKAIAPPTPGATPQQTPESSVHEGSLRSGGFFKRSAKMNGSEGSMKKSRSGMLRRIESFFRKSNDPPLDDSASDTKAAAAAAELAAYERMVSPFASFPMTEAPVCLNPKKWVTVTLSETHWISPDTVLVRFALQTPQHVLGLPTGQHFMIKGKDRDGKPVIRAYTPTSPNTDAGFVDLVIKVYFPSPEYPLGGKLSQFIGALNPGDTIDIKGPIGEITYLGRGKFNVQHVGEVNTKRITLIGAGTGITPLLQIAAACLRDDQDDTKLRLVFANRHESDILCRRIVDNMAARYPKQFEAHYVLSKPPDNWVLTGKGSSGRVNLSILRQHGFAFEDPGDASDPGAIGLTCGSDAFNEHAAFANLLQMGYPRDRMFAF